MGSEVSSLTLDSAVTYGSLVLLFAAYFLALEAIFLSFARRTTTRSLVSKRLTPEALLRDHQESLVKVRQRRSLSADGEYTLPFKSLNRLIVQSGVTWGPTGLPVIFVAISGLVLVLTLSVSGSLSLALALALMFGGGLPLFGLSVLRNRRRKNFERQFPEAVEILVRSLKAGHPVSAAIRLVARELPDPVGTEFAMVADELTYGLDLETAMNNLGTRVGQEDLALVIIAMSIQARTGGNLAELLSGMSKVVRERLKMRLKVKALSAEGRFSAAVLSLLPPLLFGLLLVIAPGFYGDVWSVGFVKPVLVLAALWMITGNILIIRMVRFEA